MRTAFHSVAINPDQPKGELAVLFAGNAQTPPAHQVGPQVLDYYLIHMIREGRGNFSCHGKTYSLQAGDHFMIFPGELVMYESDQQDPWSYCWIGFKGTSASQILSRCGFAPSRPIIRMEQLADFESFFSSVEQVLHEANAGASMEAEAYLRLVLAGYLKLHAAEENLGKPVPAGSQQVEKAVRWLTLQYTRPVTIKEMAGALGYHRTYLSKLFKQEMGISPRQFLLKIRMERARTLLSEPLTIEEIASSVGFSDPLYFSKQFKKWFGEAPSEYRQKRPFASYDCSL